MGTITYTIPTPGSTLNSIADPEIATALQTILTWANGNVDASNISAVLAQAAGVNQNAQAVKGAVNIAASQSTSSTTYTTLATPDQVTGIVLPTNGLIQIWFLGTWKESVSSAGAAAIFLGANQIQGGTASAPFLQSAGIGGTSGQNVPLTSYQYGLASPAGTTGYAGDATTGQTVSAPGGYGGTCEIFAAAGTYTVSVQFKASSGTVTAASRKLWVQAISFA